MWQQRWWLLISIVVLCLFPSRDVAADDAGASVQGMIVYQCESHAWCQYTLGSTPSSVVIRSVDPNAHVMYGATQRADGVIVFAISNSLYFTDSITVQSWDPRTNQIRTHATFVGEPWNRDTWTKVNFYGMVADGTLLGEDRGLLVQKNLDGQIVRVVDSYESVNYQREVELSPDRTFMLSWMGPRNPAFTQRNLLTDDTMAYVISPYLNVYAIIDDTTILVTESSSDFYHFDGLQRQRDVIAYGIYDLETGTYRRLSITPGDEWIISNVSHGYMLVRQADKTVVLFHLETMARTSLPITYRWYNTALFITATP